MSDLETLYGELQQAKYKVIEALQTNDNNKPKALEKLEEACEKICFDYKGELQHCKEIAYENCI